MGLREDLRDEYFSTTSNARPLPEDISLLDIQLDSLPRHVSIIMDGNGRWAKARGLDRFEGHKAGVDSLRETVTASVRLGLEVLSVYAFSTENWKRPQTEVQLLMHLFATTLVHELPLFAEQNVRLKFLGDLEALPKKTRSVFKKGLEQTEHNTGMTFALAVNYGGRAEILRGVRTCMEAALRGELDSKDLTEEHFSQTLFTAELPDPDLLIRTSGELRLSNYLLWQLAYAELYYTKLYWPDFDRFELLRAIAAYQNRRRRFGGI